jgi:hypothetical protein
MLQSHSRSRSASRTYRKKPTGGGNYGDKAARAIAEFQRDIHQRDPAERERVITEQIAFAMARDGEQRTTHERG